MFNFCKLFPISVHILSIGLLIIVQNILVLYNLSCFVFLLKWKDTNSTDELAVLVLVMTVTEEKYD